MDTDRNLLFGVLALQADLIDARHFAEACSAWSSRKETPLANLLIERGWLTPDDKADVEKLLNRKISKHQGDVKDSLAEVIDERVRDTIGELPDTDLRKSLAAFSFTIDRHIILADTTTAEVPESRERYTLSRLHATGGLGRVWLAHDSSLHRNVALKELRPERVMHRTIWARFLREAQVTGQLEHPSIVPVYELSSKADSKTPFYTMRFVRGRTLAQAVKSYHTMRQAGQADTLLWRELLSALVGVCNAISYAHSRGVIHRDIKPQNVVLGDYGEVMVLDWGLAKLLDQHEPVSDSTAPPLEVEETSADGTMEGQILGTPTYMAPEQAEGRLDLISSATDIYGIGAILYEILTGRPPFVGSETASLLNDVVHTSPPRPRSLVPTAPPALEAICLKAIQKKQSDRYETVKHLTDDLQHYLADEPTSAYREPLITRAARWMRRHRTGVVAAVAALIVGGICLAIASAFLFSAWKEADQQRAAASTQRDIAAQQRDKAAKNYQLARSAVDAFTTEVSESSELKSQGLELLRRSLLQNAVNFYQKFVQEEGEEPALLAEQGRAHLRLADLSRLMDRNDQALASYQAGLAIFQRLTNADDQTVSYKRDLADSYYKMGRYHHDTGHFDKAEEPYQQALAIVQKLQGRLSPADYQHDLARIQHSLARIYRDTGRMEKAKPLYEQSLALRRQLVKDHPKVDQYHDDLGWTLFNLGNFYNRVRQLDLSEKFYKENIDVWKALADAHPDMPLYTNQVAMALNNLGNLFADTGRPKEAEQAHLQTLAVREKLRATHPQIAQYQEDVAKCYSNLASIYLEAGKLEQAETSCKKAIDLRQIEIDAHPEMLDYASWHSETESQMGMIYRDKGQFPEALKWYDRAADRLKGVLQKEPKHAEAQSFAAAVELRTAVLLCQMGRANDIRIEIKQDPIAKDDPPEINVARLLIRAHTGDVAQVIPTAKEIASQITSGRDLFDLACVCALCRDNTLAVQLLHRAAATDYFKHPIPLGRLEKDPALTPLRTLDAYQKLLIDVEKK